MSTEHTTNILGIDENGLGPLMGPLVVTGVLLKQISEKHWLDDISDSKQFFSRTAEKFSKLETVAASLFYLKEGREPTSPAEILYNFCKDSICLSGINICTGNIPKKFYWSSHQQRKNKQAHFCEWFSAYNIKIKAINSVSLCPRRINDFTSKDNNKFLLDLCAFCDIVKETSDKNNLFIYAGRVGGMKFYTKRLKYLLPEYRCKTLEENKDRSLYRMSSPREEFTFGFFTDVEKISFSAALASLVGKYIRELYMEGIRRTLDISTNISGYHDSKTTSYIRNNDFGRFPSSCLFRRR